MLLSGLVKQTTFFINNTDKNITDKKISKDKNIKVT